MFWIFKTFVHLFPAIFFSPPILLSCFLLPLFCFSLNVHYFPTSLWWWFPWLYEMLDEAGAGARISDRLARTRSVARQAGTGCTALKIILSQQAAQNLSWWEFYGGDSRPSGGERSMTGREPGRCLLLRWIEIRLPQRATNAGHFSDPNYRPDAGLKAKGMLLAIRKCGPTLPTHVCTWEEKRRFFMFQENVCSEDVPVLLKLCLAPKKMFLSRFVFLPFFNLSPRQMSELERQVQISNRL